MQILSPADARDRVGFVAPRWTQGEEHDVQGTLFRCLPVAGSLYNGGHEVVFFDQEHDLDRHDRSSEFAEALAGVTVVFFWMNELWPSAQTLNTLRIATLIRSWYPELRVVVGGSFITICPPEMLFVKGPVEFFIRGYGEQACPQLLDVLAGQGSMNDVPGLVWHDSEGYHGNPIAYEPMGSENSAVMYRLLDFSPYIQQRGGIFGNDQPTLIIGTGQGCGKRCKFCYWQNHRPSIFPAEQIVKAAKRLRDSFDVRQFYLADLDFFMNLNRPRAMAQLWKQQLPDCHWFTLCSPIDALKLTDNDWRDLALGGCVKLEFGTETGSPAMLKRIGKRHTPEQIVAITERALSHGIHTLHNIIFGFVGETADDRRRSLELIARLHALDPARVTFAVRMYQPTPETPMGEEALKHVPDFPRTLEDVLEYRQDYADPDARMMPWLPQRDEREIKALVGFYLPLATSNLAPSTFLLDKLYRGMRALAWGRLRTGFLRMGVERLICTRWLGHQVFTQTYRP